MLSKILSARDAEKAQPLVFAAVERRSEANRERKAGSAETLEIENRQLRERVSRLESEVAAVGAASLESGRVQGETAIRRELTPVLERMTASIAEIVGMREDVRRRAEKDVIELSLLIAKRVLHREVNVDKTALSALARVIFERLARAESYRVTVHPQFAGAIAGALPGSQAATVQIEPDPNCAPGTFILRSKEGVIDASVDAQLEEIGRGLIDRLAGA